MNNPLDFITNKYKKNQISELEKLVGFSPKGGGDKIAETAAMISKQKKSSHAVHSEEEKYWDYYKVFAQLFEKYKRSFALFIGDILDIMLAGSLQAKIVKELIEEKINKMRKVREAAAIKEAVTRKHNVQRKRPSNIDVEVGGEKRIYLQHFIKRKYFLAAMFLDNDEYPNYKKLVKQIEEACDELVKKDVLNSSEERKEELNKIVGELKYEVSQKVLLYIWKLLAADNFEHLDWIYNECKSLYLLRPAFYEDLDVAYQSGKKMLRLLISDIT